MGLFGSIGKAIGGVLKVGAPIAGTALGGPLGGLIGGAVSRGLGASGAAGAANKAAGIPSKYARQAMLLRLGLMHRMQQQYNPFIAAGGQGVGNLQGLLGRSALSGRMGMATGPPNPAMGNLAQMLARRQMMNRGAPMMGGGAPMMGGGAPMMGGGY